MTVTVTDNGGLTATATKMVTVRSAASQPGNQPPVAQLSVTPTSGEAPLSVSADASASSDPGGMIASTNIDFGDGTTESAATASHVFGTPGTYTVTATVTDKGGLTAIKTINVVVVAHGAGFTTHGFTIPTAHPRLWKTRRLGFTLWGAGIGWSNVAATGLSSVRLRSACFAMR